MADVTQNNGPTGLDVRDPDAIQSGMIDVWGWVEANAKIFMALIVVALLAGIAWVVMQWMGQRQEKKAQDAYYAVEAKYTKIKEGFDRAKFKAFMPAAPPQAGAPEDKAATGDLSKDYGALVTDLEQVARTHSKTAAGAQAAILAAETYLQYKQPDKAIEIAQVPVQNLGDKSLLSNLARVLWGTALASKDDCKGAISTWQPVLGNKAVSFLHSDVNLRAGLCHEALGENDKAREMYQRAAAGDNAQDPSGGMSAKTLLRALDAKMKSPAAAPAPAKQG